MEKRKISIPFTLLEITNAARSYNLMTGTYTHAHTCQSQASGEFGICVCHGLKSTAITNLGKGKCDY